MSTTSFPEDFPDAVGAAAHVRSRERAVAVKYASRPPQVRVNFPRIRSLGHHGFRWQVLWQPGVPPCACCTPSSGGRTAGARVDHGRVPTMASKKLKTEVTRGVDDAAAATTQCDCHASVFSAPVVVRGAQYLPAFSHAARRAVATPGPASEYVALTTRAMTPSPTLLCCRVTVWSRGSLDVGAMVRRRDCCFEGGVGLFSPLPLKRDSSFFLLSRPDLCDAFV